MIGGASCPSVLAATSTAAALVDGYPTFFIIGMVKVPVVTILAMLEPDTMPVRPLPMTAALAGPPLKPPKRLRASCMKYFPPPALSSIAPKRTNKKTMVAETSKGMP